MMFNNSLFLLPNRTNNCENEALEKLMFFSNQSAETEWYHGVTNVFFSLEPVE